MITEWSHTVSNSEFTVLFWKFLLEVGGEGRGGGGGVLPWGRHYTKIAIQTAQIPYSVTRGLQAFEISTFNSTPLSFLSQDSFIKTQDFFLFFFSPTFPAVRHCPNAMFCQVIDAFFWCLLAVCTDWALETQQDAHAWASGCEHTASQILLHNCCTLSHIWAPGSNLSFSFWSTSKSQSTLLAYRPYREEKEDVLPWVLLNFDIHTS